MTTEALVERVMAVDLAYTVQRMGVIAARSGNPFGIAIHGFGRATALVAAQLPSPRFNRIVGLTDEEAPLLPELLAWYAARRISPRIEIRPGSLNAALADALTRAGFRQTGFHASLIAEATVTPIPDAEVHLVETPAMMERFLDTYLAGWGFPPVIQKAAKDNMRGWLGLQGWRLYVAEVEGRPAAAAILFLDGDVGYLADACVHPAYRGQRLHAVMLAQRQHEAMRSGVSLLCSQAAFNSTSHRNMERAGLRLLHTQSEWSAH